MNQVLAGATALIMALLLWGFGKKPRGAFITDNGQKKFKTHDFEQIALVHTSQEPSIQKAVVQLINETDWEPPKNPQERIILRKHLQKLITGSPDERLQAVTLSDLWGHAIILPILRKGLRDSDSRVITKAASALEKHRGVPSSTNGQEKGTPRPPRNVALMR